MKLIIDIPEEVYRASRIIDAKHEDVIQIPLEVLANGTPLDDVKAEIAEEICLTDNPYTGETKCTIEHLKLLEILNNIGKAESEVK